MIANTPTPIELVIEYLANLRIDPTRVETNGKDLVAVINDQEVICLLVDVGSKYIKVYRGLEELKLTTENIGDALTAVGAIISEPGLADYNPYGG